MPDLDDMLDEEKDIKRYFLEQGELEHEQALISAKKSKTAFSVERNIVNSYKYHEKFEKLPVSKNLQEQLYLQCGRLLEYVDNLTDDKIGQERLLAVDYITGNLITDNFERDGALNSTGFDEKEMNLIEKCPNSIVLVHNHSKNDMPSAKDLIAYLDYEKIKLSLIACHNGDIYAIYGVKEEFRTIYEMLLNEEKEKTTEIEIAKRRATTRAYLANDSLSQKKKLFWVEKL